MKVDVLDIEGKKLREVELPSAVFEAPINVDLMHQAYVRQMANARLGTHETKVRGEVAGGGRIHTPHPRSYEQRMPKKMRQAALRSALSAKAAEFGVVVVDEINLSEAKTRIVMDALKNLVGQSTALVVLAE